MGSLTVTYARGRFLLGAKEISIEIDGILYGTIVGGGSRTFEMPDGEHLVVLRYSHVTTRVELHLSGEESFTVSWDRTIGGMRSRRGSRGMCSSTAALGSTSRHIPSWLASWWRWSAWRPGGASPRAAYLRVRPQC